MKFTSRRDFFKTASLASAGFCIIPRHVLGRGFIAPSDKLLIAAIGIGGFAETELMHLYNTGKTEIAFLCDVDDGQAANSCTRFPQAKFYKDYRAMLHQNSNYFDAVIISTPNHMHAPQAIAAMQLHKHVFIQQPLSHTLQEGRVLHNAALQYKVVTQLNNTPNNRGIQKLIRWHEAKLIGDIHTVYCATNHIVPSQGIGWPRNTSSIPSQLNWNLWQGVAPVKDYINGLLPTHWRAWWNYGNGILGDMAPSILGPVFTLLNLGLPLSVECKSTARYYQPFTPIGYPESSPLASHLVFNFEGKLRHSNIILHWMDGGFLPKELGTNKAIGKEGNAIIFIGTKGKIVCGAHGDAPQLLLDSKSMECADDSVKNSDPIMGNTQHALWVDAAMAGYHSQAAKAIQLNLKQAAILNECIHLGNMAIRYSDLQQKNRPRNNLFQGLPIRLDWNPLVMKVSNMPEANQFITKVYRQF